MTEIINEYGEFVNQSRKNTRQICSTTIDCFSPHYSALYNIKSYLTIRLYHMTQLNGSAPIVHCISEWTSLQASTYRVPFFIAKFFCG